MAVVQNGNASAVDYVTTDQLNTPRAVTDSSQTVLWSWTSDPFGNGQPMGSLTYNLRFPGQYYDAETGHNYNMNRDYDPNTSRYIESDPNGLLAGINTYDYATEDPLGASDPSGLSSITGSWITPPKINIDHYGVDNVSIVSPSFSLWGYLKFVQVSAHASGYVNIDVRCHSDDCPARDWEIHNRISFGVNGSFKVGPNLYALLVGLRFGPRIAIPLNVLIAEADLLTEEKQVLNELASRQAGPILQSIMAGGPTAICYGSSP